MSVADQLEVSLDAALSPDTPETHPDDEDCGGTGVLHEDGGVVPCPHCPGLRSAAQRLIDGSAGHPSRPSAQKHLWDDLAAALSPDTEEGE